MSALLVWAFLIQDLAGAAPENIFSAGKAPLFAQAPRFEIPASMGVVEEVYQAEGQRKIYLIQDAHTNESCQASVSRLLEFLNQSQKLEYVFLEAGTGDNSLSYLREKGSEAARRAVAHRWLQKGELKGSEHLDVASNLPLKLWGVEDKKLYFESVTLYRAIVERRAEFQEYLDGAAAAVKALKPLIYNPLLLAYDSKNREYHAGKITATDYVDYLVRQASSYEIPLKEFPFIGALRDLRKNESRIDFNAANAQQMKLFSALSSADARELEEAAAQFKAVSAFSGLGDKDAKAKAFYAMIEEKAQGNAAAYPDLLKYTSYLRQAGTINMRELARELEALENRIYEAVTFSDDERSLRNSARGYEKIKALFDLKLTPEEFQEYRSDRRFSIEWMTGFLNRKISDLRRHYSHFSYLKEGFGEYAAKAEAFYELTRRRDEAFVRGAIEKMEAEKISGAVLVTGGYHTPNLKEILKREKISFVSITPQTLKETNQKRYEKILLDRAAAESSAPQGTAADKNDVLPLREAAGLIMNFEQEIIDEDLRNGGTGGTASGPGSLGGWPAVTGISAARLADQVIDWWKEYWNHEPELADRYPREVEEYIVRSMAMLSPIGQPRVLDAGAGREFRNSLLLKRSYPAFRIDALDVISVSSAPPGVNYRKAALESTGLPDAGFDGVLCSWTLDYTAAQSAAAEIRRIMQDKGIGVFILHHPDSRVISNIREKYEKSVRSKAAIDYMLDFIGRSQPIDISSKRFRDFEGSDQEVIRDIARMYNSVPSFVKAEIRGRLVEGISPDRDAHARMIAMAERLFSNLFRDKEEVRKFFENAGFHVAPVETIKSEGKDVAYGVVVMKNLAASRPAGTEDSSGARLSADPEALARTVREAQEPGLVSRGLYPVNAALREDAALLDRYPDLEAAVSEAALRFSDADLRRDISYFYQLTGIEIRKKRLQRILSDPAWLSDEDRVQKLIFVYQLILTLDGKKDPEIDALVERIIFQTVESAYGVVFKEGSSFPDAYFYRAAMRLDGNGKIRLLREITKPMLSILPALTSGETEPDELTQIKIGEDYDAAARALSSLVLRQIVSGDQLVLFVRGLASEQRGHAVHLLSMALHRLWVINPSERSAAENELLSLVQEADAWSSSERLLAPTSEKVKAGKMEIELPPGRVRTIPYAATRQVKGVGNNAKILAVLPDDPLLRGWMAIKTGHVLDSVMSMLFYIDESGPRPRMIVGDMMSDAFPFIRQNKALRDRYKRYPIVLMMIAEEYARSKNIGEIIIPSSKAIIEMWPDINHGLANYVYERMPRRYGYTQALTAPVPWGDRILSSGLVKKLDLVDREVPSSLEKLYQEPTVSAARMAALPDDVRESLQSTLESLWYTDTSYEVADAAKLIEFALATMSRSIIAGNLVPAYGDEDAERLKYYIDANNRGVWDSDTLAAIAANPAALMHLKTLVANVIALEERHVPAALALIRSFNSGARMAFNEAQIDRILSQPQYFGTAAAEWTSEDKRFLSPPSLGYALAVYAALLVPGKNVPTRQLAMELHPYLYQYPAEPEAVLQAWNGMVGATSRADLGVRARRTVDEIKRYQASAPADPYWLRRLLHAAGDAYTPAQTAAAKQTAKRLADAFFPAETEIKRDQIADSLVQRTQPASLQKILEWLDRIPGLPFLPRSQMDRAWYRDSFMRFSSALLTTHALANKRRAADPMDFFISSTGSLSEFIWNVAHEHTHEFIPQGWTVQAISSPEDWVTDSAAVILTDWAASEQGRQPEWHSTAGILGPVAVKKLYEKGQAVGGTLDPSLWAREVRAFDFLPVENRVYLQGIMIGGIALGWARRTIASGASNEQNSHRLALRFIARFAKETAAASLDELAKTAAKFAPTATAPVASVPRATPRLTIGNLSTTAAAPIPTPPASVQPQDAERLLEQKLRAAGDFDFLMQLYASYPLPSFSQSDAEMQFNMTFPNLRLSGEESATLFRMAQARRAARQGARLSFNKNIYLLLAEWADRFGFSGFLSFSPEAQRHIRLIRDRAAALEQAKKALQASAISYDDIPKQMPKNETAVFGAEPAIYVPKKSSYLKPASGEDGVLYVTEQNVLFVPAEQMTPGRVMLTTHLKNCSAAYGRVTTVDGRVVYLLSHQYQYQFRLITLAAIEHLFEKGLIREAEIHAVSYRDTQSVYQALEAMKQSGRNIEYDVTDHRYRSALTVGATLLEGNIKIHAHDWSSSRNYQDYQKVDFSRGSSRVLYESPKTEGARMAFNAEETALLRYQIAYLKYRKDEFQILDSINMSPIPDGAVAKKMESHLWAHRLWAPREWHYKGTGEIVAKFFSGMFKLFVPGPGFIGRWKIFFQRGFEAPAPADLSALTPYSFKLSLAISEAELAVERAERLAGGLDQPEIVESMLASYADMDRRQVFHRIYQGLSGAYEEAETLTRELADRFRDDEEQETGARLAASVEDQLIHLSVHASENQGAAFSTSDLLARLDRAGIKHPESISIDDLARYNLRRHTFEGLERFRSQKKVRLILTGAYLDDCCAAVLAAIRDYASEHPDQTFEVSLPLELIHYPEKITGVDSETEDKAGYAKLNLQFILGDSHSYKLTVDGSVISDIHVPGKPDNLVINAWSDGSRILEHPAEPKTSAARLSKSVSVRTYQPSDMEAILDLWQTEIRPTQENAPSRTEFRSFLSRRLGNPLQRLFVAVESGQVVGFANTAANPQGSLGIISQIAVRPDHVEWNVYELLTAEALEWLRTVPTAKEIMIPTRNKDYAAVLTALDFKEVMPGHFSHHLAKKKPAPTYLPKDAADYPAAVDGESFDQISNHLYYWSYLNRHVAQWRFIAENAMPAVAARALAKASDPQSPVIEVVVGGASTGEELARAYHEIISWLKNAGYSVAAKPGEAGWRVRVTGYETNPQALGLARDKIAGTRPFVWSLQDGTYQRESTVAYAEAVLSTIRAHAESFKADASMVEMSILDPKFLESAPDPEIAIFNNVFYQLPHDDSLGLQMTLSEIWKNTWISVTASDGQYFGKPDAGRKREVLSLFLDKAGPYSAQPSYFLAKPDGTGEGARFAIDPVRAVSAASLNLNLSGNPSQDFVKAGTRPLFELQKQMMKKVKKLLDDGQMDALTELVKKMWWTGFQISPKSADVLERYGIMNAADQTYIDGAYGSLKEYISYWGDDESKPVVYISRGRINEGAKDDGARLSGSAAYKLRGFTLYLPAYLEDQLNIRWGMYDGAAKVYTRSSKIKGRDDHNFIEFAGSKDPRKVLTIFFRDKGFDVLLQSPDHPDENFFLDAARSGVLAEYAVGRNFHDDVLGIPRTLGPARARAVRDFLLTLDSKGLASRRDGSNNLGLRAATLRVPQEVVGGSTLVRMLAEREGRSRFVLLQDRLNPDKFIVFESTVESLIDSSNGASIPTREQKDDTKTVIPSDYEPLALLLSSASRKLLHTVKAEGSVFYPLRREKTIKHEMGFPRKERYSIIKVSHSTSVSLSGSKGTGRHDGSHRAGDQTGYPVFVFKTDIAEDEPIPSSVGLSSAGTSYLLFERSALSDWPAFLGYEADAQYRYFKRLKGFHKEGGKTYAVYRLLDAADPEYLLQARMDGDDYFRIAEVAWAAGPLKGQEVRMRGRITLSTLAGKYGRRGSPVEIPESIQNEFTPDTTDPQVRKSRFLTPQLAFDQEQMPILEPGDAAQITESGFSSAARTERAALDALGQGARLAGDLPNYSATDAQLGAWRDRVIKIREDVALWKSFFQNVGRDDAGFAELKARIDEALARAGSDFEEALLYKLTAPRSFIVGQASAALNTAADPGPEGLIERSFLYLESTQQLKRQNRSSSSGGKILQAVRRLIQDVEVTKQGSRLAARVSIFKSKLDPDIVKSLKDLAVLVRSKKESSEVVVLLKRSDAFNYVGSGEYVYAVSLKDHPGLVFKIFKKFNDYHRELGTMAKIFSRQAIRPHVRTRNISGIPMNYLIIDDQSGEKPILSPFTYFSIDKEGFIVEPLLSDDVDSQDVSQVHIDLRSLGIDWDDAYTGRMPYFTGTRKAKTWNIGRWGEHAVLLDFGRLDYLQGARLAVKNLDEFVDLDTAIFRQLDPLIRENIRTNPGRPVLVLLSGQGNAGKSTLADSINPETDTPKSQYGKKYVNLGLPLSGTAEGYRSRVFVVEGDKIHRQLEAYKAGSDLYDEDTPWGAVSGIFPPKIMNDEKAWILEQQSKGEYPYQSYLAHFIPNLFDELIRNYPDAAPVIFYEEAGLETYAGSLEASGARRETLVIRAVLEARGDDRVMKVSEPTVWKKSEGKPEGARLAVSQASLEALLLEQVSRLKAGENSAEFALFLSGDNPDYFFFSKESATGAAIRVRGQTEPLITVTGNLDQMLKDRRAADPAEHAREVGRGLLGLLQMGRHETDRVLASDPDRAPLAHAVPLAELRSVSDVNTFSAHANILLNQIAHVRRNRAFQGDIFFLEGMDVLEPWQREIIVQTVSAAKADNFVRAEGLEKFDGVVMKYVATDNLDAVPSAGDGRTLLIPVTGVTADSLLGWYSLFKIGGTLGGVFSAHYKDRAIDFSKVSADKIPIQAVNFFKTRGEKVTQTLLFEMTKGDIRDLGLLKAISFYLPMAQRIPIDAFVQAARMAVQQVGSAA